MTQQENQQPQVSLETPFEEVQVEEPAATAEELLRNLNSKTALQIFEESTEDRFNALEHLIIAFGNLTLAQLSKGK